MKLKDGSLVLHSPAEATPDLEAVVGKLGNRVSGIIGKLCSAAKYSQNNDNCKVKSFILLNFSS